MKKAIFWDRDGTLIEHYTGGKYTVHPGQIRLKPDFSVIGKLQKKFLFFLITNGGGIGRGWFTQKEFWVGEKFFEDKAKQDFGVTFDECHAAFWNPKNPKNFIKYREYRKPSPKFIFEIHQRFPQIDLKESLVIGDSSYDMEMAENAGCRKIFIAEPHNDPEYAHTGGTTPDFTANNLVEVVEFLESSDSAK